jgi:hypothetical protein
MSFTGVTSERTYYDGQMPVEETVHLDSTLQKLTRNFVGARGIEMMETTQNSATTQAYPLYDTHGNMVATLSKNSAGTSWSLGNERSYDVWGSVRSGAATGGPKGRYVANLGHVADDESGSIPRTQRYYTEFRYFLLLINSALEKPRVLRSEFRRAFWLLNATSSMILCIEWSSLQMR